MAAAAADRYPGLIFSRFPLQLDLAGATGYAIDLIRCAIRGGGGFRVDDANRDQLHRLYQEFAAIGGSPTRRSGPDGDADPDVRVLRLDNSFRTPPASRWADYREAGEVQRTLVLSLRRCTREVCVLRGPSVGDFTRRADRAGALLPALAEHRAAPLLEDVDSWLMRVNRRRELASEQYYFATEDGSPPAGEPVPRAAIVQHFWESTRVSTYWGETVTDHRGNVERWLGFVLAVLKECDPDAVEVRRVPEGRHDYRGWNAILTLRAMNIYQASARAMELAGWVWADPDDGGVGRTGGASRGKPADGICFEDPGASCNYPPPAAGRYVRYHDEDVPAGCEPEWRPAWAWADDPADGWTDAHLIPTEAGWVPLGCGTPPPVCEWLPRNWPAGHFPLGPAAEHLVAWRAHCRAVLVEMSDAPPPDHKRFGWRTITRATRHLAHHRGVLAAERVVAPLPASRPDAWREVEPVLDGLIAKARANVQLLTAATNPVPPPPPNPTGDRVRCQDTDRSVWLDGKRMACELELPVFRFFKVLVEAYPDPVTYSKISERAPGLKGKHPTRDLKDRLPAPLEKWVQSGKHGYFLQLPEQPKSK